MNARITQFERLWATRPPLPRIMTFEPELHMPPPDRLRRQTNDPEEQTRFDAPLDIELSDELADELSDELATIMASWPVRTDGQPDRSEDRLYALVTERVEETPLTQPVLVRVTNDHERLRPDLRERFWSADAEEKAELLATLSPIESSFPGLPSLPPITAEEVKEILRSMRR